MSVVSVGETYASRTSSQGADWTRTYSRSWRVETNSAATGAKTVREACPVSLGNSFDDGDGTDAGSYCQSIEARCITDDGKSWEVVATYGPYNPETNPQSPIDRPIQVSWGTASYEKILDFDADGTPVLNSAGEPFDPPVTVDDDRLVLNVTRCELNFDPGLADLYKNCLNNDSWLGAEAGTIKLKPITAALKKDAEIGYYWEVSYSFEWNKDGWNEPVYDQGLNELVDVSGTTKRKPILTATGVPIQDPVPLDGEGLALAIGEDPVGIECVRYPLRDFGVLNFTEADFPNTVW